MSLRAGGLDPTTDRAGSGRAGLGPRPLVWGAFAFSVAVHVVAVVLYPTLFPRLVPEGFSFALPSATARPDGVEVIRLIEVEAEPERERPDDPEEIEEVEVAEARVDAPSLGERPTVVLERPGLTAAERLRPGLSDRRLWAPLPPEFGALTLEQREELLVAGRLTEWYDSVSAAMEAERRWTDWTFTDGDGDRWGVADGQLHLGDYSIPFPFAFGGSAAQRDYMRQWDEIARQGANAQVQQTVRERIEAIRERRDRERAAARADSSGANR